MYATQPEPPKPPFQPVTLTLETQQEVDAIFAVLNHSDLRQTIGLPFGTYHVLAPFRSIGYQHVHADIEQLIYKRH